MPIKAYEAVMGLLGCPWDVTTAGPVHSCEQACTHF
jgi:hypothetical protein